MNRNNLENDSNNKLINFPQRKHTNYIQRESDSGDEYDEVMDDYNDFDDEDEEFEEYDEEMYDEEYDDESDEDYDSEEASEDSSESENLFEEKSEESDSSGIEKSFPKKSLRKKNKKKSLKDKKKVLNKFGKKLLPKSKGLVSGEIKNQIRRKLATFLMSPKGIIVVIILFLAILLTLIILMETGIIGDYKGSSTDGTATGQGITASKCEYDLNGINQDTLVELINCDATKDNYKVFETMTLEKYIAGVAIAEIGEEAIDNPEAMKAQIIAVRSYTLTRNIDKYGVGFDKAKNVIRMRACENDQVYWDYNKDIYRGSGGIAYYSPYEYTPSEGETPWKRALTEEEKQKYEAIVQSVIGEYAVDSSGSVYHTPYSSNEEKTGPTDRFLSLAKDNAGTANGKYTSILMNVYPEVTGTKVATCSMRYYNDAGDYSTWKQKAKLGAPWAGTVIGYDSENKKNITIDDVGCTITSIAMQIKHSGIPTGEITDFNPGTFATALKNAGVINSGGGIKSYWDIQKVVPGFKYVSDNVCENKDVKGAAEKGYYVIIEVRKHDKGQHWVALDVKNSANANWNEIYMWDPATTSTTISGGPDYKVNRLVCFKAEES